MKCAACGQECFDETYPQVVFQDDKKCICEECSIDFEEIGDVVQFRQDLIEQGFVEPIFIPKVEIDLNKVKEIADQIQLDYESKELKIDGYARHKALEFLDKAHQDKN